MIILPAAACILFGFAVFCAAEAVLRFHLDGFAERVQAWTQAAR